MKRISIIIVLCFSGMMASMMAQPICEKINYFNNCLKSDFPSTYEKNDVFLCLNTLSAFELNAIQIRSSNIIASKTAVIHPIVKFHYPMKPILNLFCQDIVLYFDLTDDGIENYSEVEWGGTATVTFTPGVKTISYMVETALGNCKGQLNLEIKPDNAPYLAPTMVQAISTGLIPAPACNPYTAGSSYALPKMAEGNLYIKLGEGNSQLTRPIIMVEGIDFGTDVVLDPDNNNQVMRYGSTGWDNVWKGQDEKVRPAGSTSNFLTGYPQQIANLIKTTEPEDVNFDMLMLDFKDGADYIQRNAELLKEVIRWVNQNKDQNSCFQNVVCGLSMGGQVARYALRDMEMDGEDHDTRMYISFDSPHLGANIPLALQSFVWFMGNYYPPGDESTQPVETAIGTWQNLNRPATMQMLFNNLGGMYQKGEIEIEVGLKTAGYLNTIDSYSNEPIKGINAAGDYNCLRETFKAELNAQGLPQRTYNVAIANGSGTATFYPFAGGAQLLGVCLPYAPFTGLLLNIDEVTFRIGMYANNGVNSIVCNDVAYQTPITNTIFHAKRPKTGLTFQEFFPSLELYYSKVRLTTLLDQPYDNAPGSGRFDIGDDIEPSIRSNHILQDWIIGTSEAGTCFIPTVSALGLAGVPFGTSPNGFSSPFDLQFVALVNEPHVQSNIANSGFIDDEHSTNEGNLDPILIDTYNFGKYRNRIGKVEVQSGGYLRINDTGKTDYLTGLDSDKEVFHAYTKGCGVDIDVLDGGNFILGEDQGAANKSGVVHVLDGSTVRIHAGGTLYLARNSSLIIESGGELIIEAGARILLWDGIMNDGNASVEIQSGGKLTINGEFGYEGNGYFHFKQGNILSLNTSEFKLHGYNKDCRFILLDTDAALDIDNKNLNLKNGKVNYRGFALIKGQSGTYNLDHVKMQGTGHSIGLQANHATGVNCKQSDFVFMYKGLDIKGQSFSLNFPNPIGGTKIKLHQCSFTGSYIGLEAQLILDLELQTCLFDGANILTTNAPLDKHALKLEKVFLVNNYGTTIKNYKGGKIAIQGNQSSSIIPGPSNGNNAAAVLLKDVPFYQMYGGLVDDNDIGMYCPLNAKANVFMYNGVTVSDNLWGVLLEKGGVNSGGDYGLVLMSCSKLLRNQKGIAGKDVLLRIDGLENAQAEQSGAAVNTFQTGISGNQLLNVCYIDRTDVMEVKATNNIFVDPPIYSLNNTSMGGSCGYYLSNVNLLWSNLSAYPQEGCRPGLRDPNGAGLTYVAPGFTGTVTTCNTPTGAQLHETFGSAYRYWLNEGFAESISNFTPISGIPNAMRSIMNPNCRNYIDVSRVFTSGLTDNAIGDTAYIAGRSAKLYEDVTTRINDLKLSPNPSQAITRVTMPIGDYTLTVMDMNGKIMKQISFNSATDIATHDIASGMYFVKVLGNDGTQYQEKLIVNH